MKPRIVLLLIAAACIGLLATGLYLQLVKNMLPCPLCVLQRYAFVAVAIFCLIGAAANAPRMGAGFGLMGALGGAGVAGYHLWVMAHPAVSCGIDPLETSLNTIPSALWFPVLLQADGMCSTVYPPIFGLSIPQWSLAWFVLFILALVWILLRKRHPYHLS